MTNASIEGQAQPLSQPAAILLTALLLGIAADYLFWPYGPFHMALTLWLTLFCSAAITFSWHYQKPWHATVLYLSLVTVAASLLLLLRDLPILMPTLLGIVFAAGLQILLRTANIGFFEARVAHFFGAVVAFPLQAGFGVLPVLGKVDWGGGWSNPRTRAITRGVLLALPLLLLFIILFSRADEGFSRYVPDLTTFLDSETPAHIMLIAVFFAISGGLLAGVLQTRSLATVEVPAGKLGAEETGIVLGLLSALFTAFVLFQLRYLFGGQEMIEATTGLTVADYARRGFFELLWVAVLTLGLLLLAAKTTRAPHLLRLFGTVMVGCVLIMLVSAVQRMLLYMDNFGLSVDRVVASTVMAWIASCLLLCAVTVLRGQDAGFASGMANLGILCCFMLIMLNPGRLVASVNVERAVEQRQPLDVDYLLGRGADIVGPLLARFDELSSRTQCDIAVSLLNRWTAAATMDGSTGSEWRLWNYSRQQARALIDANRTKLQAIANDAQRRASERLQNQGQQPTSLLLCE